MLILFFLVNGQLYAHSVKPKYHVIIDTDGALDDMRTLSMFLSGNDIRVLAITCSQGYFMSWEVHKKVSSLLSVFHHEGIQAGISEQAGAVLPEWSRFARGISWGGKISGTGNPGVDVRSLELLDRVAENYKDTITLIALGSLKTFADWIVCQFAGI